MWLLSDSIGGTQSGLTSSDWLLDPQASAATIGALLSALKSDTSTPRFFRSIAQWAAVWSRYAPLAVAMKQLSWSASTSHMSVIMQIVEEALEREVCVQCSSL